MTPMTPKKIIIHCTASKNGAVYPIEQLRKDHKARGFEDIGYHIVIQPDGEATNTRPLNKMGAHCEGENHDSIGIALVGENLFTPKQFSALRYQLDGLLLNLHQIERYSIYSHHQFPSAQKQGKTCPNLRPQILLYWYLFQDNKCIEPFIYREK